MTAGKYIIVIFFIFIGIHGFGQDIEKLKRNLATAKTERQNAIAILILGKSYAELNIDSAIRYCTRSIDAGKALNDDSIVMESYCGMGVAYDRKENIEMAERFFNKAYAIAREKYPTASVKMLINKINFYIQFNKVAEALSSAGEMLQIAEEKKDKKIEAKAYSLFASIYLNVSNYEKALVYQNKAIKLNDSLKNNDGRAEAYATIANILSVQLKDKEALKYALMVDSITTKNGDLELRSRYRMGLGIIYFNLGRYDEAISIYSELLKYYEADDRSKLFIYPSFGEALAAKGRFIEALEYFKKCEELNDAAIHIPTVTYDNDYKRAATLMKMGKADEALHYANICEKLANDPTNAGILSIDKSLYKLLTEIYLAKGDIKNMDLYHKKYEAAQDSVIVQMHTDNLAEEETQFNLSEKNRQLTELVNENELRKAHAQRQSVIITASVIGLLLGTAIVVIIVIFYRRTLKKNTLLSEQKEELAQQKKELSEQKDIIDKQVIALSNAAEMKAKFLGNVSHELRTPVTLLTGMLELMKNDTGNADAKKERLSIAYDNSRKLQHMVEEILDITRLESDEIRVNMTTVAVSPLIKRIVYAFETLMAKEQLTLIYEDAEMEGVYIDTEENKLEKIINNIIYNAIKFTRPGGTIKVVLGKNNRNINLQISDTGTGIHAIDLPHIFERYYQGDTANNAAGAGIGLALVKEFTELLGGTVSAASEAGQGSLFTLQFPISEAVVATNEKIELPEVPMPDWTMLPGRRTVLLVEDNAEMRFYLREILSQKVNIAEATNGIEALKWLEKNTADLVITDIMMPRMDGRELMAQLKNNDTYKKIPIITLTALADKDYQLEILRMGIDDYIIKPFNADELSVRVFNILNNYAERKHFKDQPTEADDLPANTAEADTLRLKINEYVLSRLNNFEVSVDDMAIELNVSRRQLFRFTKQVTGCTPAQLIKEVKLQKAYELLAEGKVFKVDDLAKQVGYEHPGYFAKQFLERFGKRPSDFL